MQGIGVIFSEIEENGKKLKQAHYFIYSCKGMTAEQILEAKRSHWSIETNSIGSWICNSVRMKAGPELTTLLKI